MRVHRAPTEPGQEFLPDDAHEPGGDHQVRLVRRGGFGERAVPLGTARVVLHPAHERRQARALGAVQARDAGPVGADGHDLGAVGVGPVLRDGVEQCLQIRT
ncbi:hypothetical protein SMD44_05333 [Streptomyces alboflavus]|uniref:Uncharacterized protein n=1 Tax=Streptomyces alboflavus TaxID=67267 RepID=A0A1Z1WHE2_9ACTN|nr:hypothetical protein SMD44_05333 [Streptomyces alboflavus]